MRIPSEQLSDVQRKFLAYWERQAGDRVAPLRQDIDVLHVPTLMPFVVFFDVLREPLDYRYRLIGTAVRDMSAREYTGMKMSEIEGRGPGSAIWSFLEDVRESRKPAFHSVPYVGPKKDFRRLNNLFLPVLDAAGETSMIIAVSHFPTS